MKHILLAVTLALGASSAWGQLSSYGRLDVVGLPRPEVIDPRPVTAERAPSSPPVYVRVRPGEEKHWKRNCSLYKACNVPVYFVRDDWYHSVYEPRYRQRALDEASERADAEARATRATRTNDEERERVMTERAATRPTARPGTRP